MLCYRPALLEIQFPLFQTSRRIKIPDKYILCILISILFKRVQTCLYMCKIITPCACKSCSRESHFYFVEQRLIHLDSVIQFGCSKCAKSNRLDGTRDKQINSSSPSTYLEISIARQLNMHKAQVKAATNEHISHRIVGN